MRTKVMVLVVIFILITPAVSNSQVGGMLRNKLNKVLNKEAQNKADSSVNKNNQQSEKEPEGRSRGLGALLGGNTDIKHAEQYDFTGRIFMIMESYEKKEVARTDFYTYFNTNALNAGIEVEIENPDNKEKSIPTKFIFDNDNRCFMVLMENEGSKTGIISTIPDDSTMASQARKQKGSEDKKPVITKTGRTKIIAGYKCDEYKVVEPGEDGYSNVWMTKDVKIKADRRNWNKAGMPSYYGYPEFEGSMMLAMEAYDKDDKMEMKMETQEINENFKHSISTAGYSFIKMNFGQAGKK